MVSSKKINTIEVANILKDLHSGIELLRTRQEEKQAVVDQFDSEEKRLFFGKISEMAVMSSIKKTNKELEKIDKEIKKIIISSNKLIQKLEKNLTQQNPYKFHATLTGIAGQNEKGFVKKVKKLKRR